MEEQPKRRRPGLNFQCIDENFMSLPKYISVFQRFIDYIEGEKMSAADLQNPDKIQKLLMHAFSKDDAPPKDEHIKSVQTLFGQTSFVDFKQHLYRYSELIATYLWVDRVQTIVTDAQEKNRILRGLPVKNSGYKLFCYLREINYVPQKDLSKNRNVQLFRNILRCTDELWKSLETFINVNFQEDFDEDEKNEITECTRNFLEERIRFKKSRRYSYVSNPAFSSNEESNGDSSRMESTISDSEQQVQGSVDEDDEDEDYDDREVESATKVQKLPSSLDKRTFDAIAANLKRKIKRTSQSSSSEAKRFKNLRSRPASAQSRISQTPTPTVEQEQVIVKNEMAEDEDPLILFEDENDSEDETQDSMSLSICNSWEKLWKEQSLCDIEFIVADISERRISAHKFVLAASSGVFSSMFKNNPRHCDIRAIYVKDYSYEVVREMLRFMYCGRVKKLASIVEELLSAASNYGVELLMDLCKQCLTKNLNDVNAIVTYKLCKKYGFQDLKVKAKAFVDEQMN